MFSVFYKLFNKICRQWSLFILIFLFALGTDASNFLPIGARSTAMGRTSVAMTGFWGIQNNQAAIALIDKYSIGINYESRLGLNELSTKSAAFIVPLNFGVVGLSFNHFGYSNYNEMKLGLAYARSFAKYLRIGIQLDFLRTNIGDNYGAKNNLTFEIGIQSDINEKITLGAYVFNPIMVKVADFNNEKLVSVIRLGIAYKFDKWLFVSLEVEKNSTINPILIRLGLEYNLKSKYFIRGGIASRYEILCFGFGINFKYFKFDIAASMHQDLGFSPQSSIIVNF